MLVVRDRDASRCFVPTSEVRRCPWQRVPKVQRANRGVVVQSFVTQSGNGGESDALIKQASFTSRLETGHVSLIFDSH